MKKPYKIVSGASTPNRRELADWLAKDGQLLIPLVELLEKGERAIDEVIDVMGRATIEAVLQMSAAQVAGPKEQGRRDADRELYWHGVQAGRKALRDAWNLDSADRAKRVLERLAGSLEHDHPGAAASIREGLDETLTVQRLGLTGALQRTLRTTNIIENLNGSVERYTRNVKRWRGGQMIQRWMASALVEAEKHFRRVRGYRDLQRLIGALDAMGPPDGVIADVA